MEYRILGPIRVLDEGHETYLNARKVQTLLAALLIKADQIVSVDQLIAEIWHEDPPRRVNASLHVYVSQVRKFLTRPGSGGSGLVTRVPGYQLSLGENTLDVREFQRRMTAGRNHLLMGRLEQADRGFGAALGLWRGRALGELSGDGPIIQGFTVWAEEARLECLELQIETRLAMGQYRQVVGPLFQLISEIPMRETFYRQLMLALYQADRQADALRVYQSARSTLNAELGVEPCQALRDLQHAILVGDVRDSRELTTFAS
ncbi:AfsR/SARP family transcriptional regulator [Streptomyces sp. NBC_00247]|uniref:AfsR/SARP family transcriptional regulator n=1 Tax=Streptomyces sp. NBC_00247 TaxID=2975689 RepID=UPI002E2E6E7C|nr:AfsR/SARP family transcriptional regulator [Streptomyces sp. NBC_00247]